MLPIESTKSNKTDLALLLFLIWLFANYFDVGNFEIENFPITTTSPKHGFRHFKRTCKGSITAVKAAAS